MQSKVYQKHENDHKNTFKTNEIWGLSMHKIFKRIDTQKKDEREASKEQLSMNELSIGRVP